MSVTEPEGTATPWPSDQLRDELRLGAPELVQGLPRVADERCVNVGLTSQHDQVDVKAVGVEDLIYDQDARSGAQIRQRPRR
jgi:hypothetical protein